MKGQSRGDLDGDFLPLVLVCIEIAIGPAQEALVARGAGVVVIDAVMTPRAGREPVLHVLVRVAKAISSSS